MEKLEKITTAVVATNVAALAVALAVPSATELTDVVEHVALAYFVAELGIKLHGAGWHLGRFTRDPWNAFDAVLIVLSLVAMVPAVAALRMARAAKLVKFLHIGKHAAVQLRGVTALARIATQH